MTDLFSEYIIVLIDIQGSVVLTPPELTEFQLIRIDCHIKRRLSSLSVLSKHLKTVKKSNNYLKVMGRLPVKSRKKHSQVDENSDYPRVIAMAHDAFAAIDSNFLCLKFTSLWNAVKASFSVRPEPAEGCHKFEEWDEFNTKINY